MTFRARVVANNRWQVTDDRHPGDLIAEAFGRRNAELVVEALNMRFGPGEQLELFEEHPTAA